MKNITTIRYTETGKPAYTAIIVDGKWYANFHKPTSITIEIGAAVDVDGLLNSNWASSTNAHIVANNIVTN